MKKDEKNFEYKIVKSEACGHVIEYKMIKSEEKPRGNLVRQVVDYAKKGKKTGINLLDNMIADAKDEKRMASPAETAELKDKAKEKKQTKLAASEEECKCEDKTEKCECEDKGMKKREKFYIQKIQELRKQQDATAHLRDSIGNAVSGAGDWLASKFNQFGTNSSNATRKRMDQRYGTNSPVAAGANAQ